MSHSLKSWFWTRLRRLDALVTRAVLAGCERMLLEVDAGNRPAGAFYRRHGFDEIARRPRYYPSGADAVVMARDLLLRVGK